MSPPGSITKAQGPQLGTVQGKNRSLSSQIESFDSAPEREVLTSAALRRAEF